MKQTLEQAAEQYGRRIDAEHPSNAATDFLAGSAWQKQQGIEWISVDNPPEPVVEHTHCWLSKFLLVSDGYLVDQTRAVFSVYKELVGWEACSITPTHYAFINLPKTDE